MLFLDDDSLSSAITDRLKIAVQYVVDRILTENDSTILDVVYSTYAPSEYQRTGEFQKAWDTKVGSMKKYVEGEFFYDSRELTVDPEMGQHASVLDRGYEGKVGDVHSVAEYMADILYEGAMGCIYRPTKRNAWKVLDKWLSNTKFRQIFEEGLNYAGLEWHRSIGRIDKTYEK